jgi:hypothetical protein
MRVANLPHYADDAKEALRVVVIVIVAVVAPVLILLWLGRVLHRLDLCLARVTGRR